jgi:hypothetical protein
MTPSGLELFRVGQEQERGRSAFHSSEEVAAPTEDGYIRADQFCFPICRLQDGGRPYMPYSVRSEYLSWRPRSQFWPRLSFG